MHQMAMDTGSQDHSILEGLITEIIFRNEQNGYTVCSLADDSVVVGVLPYLHVGESVRFHGEWIQHPDYGRQFQARHYELTAPRTEKAIQYYLSSGLIKGIGEKTAARLVREFGTKTLDILRDQPEEVAQIRGIGLERARQFSDQLREKEAYQELMLLLAPLGVGTGTILRIYRQYGNKARDILAENPYALADDVRGIGFLTADRLARELGVHPESPARIRSAVLYVLNQNLQQGHTAMPVQHCLQTVSGLLKLVIKTDHSAWTGLVADEKIYLLERANEQADQPLCVLAQLYRSEFQAAKQILILSHTEPRRIDGLSDLATIRQLIRKICRRQSVMLSDEQQKALEQALLHSVSVLTGGPGTGKTTMIRVLCDCLIALNGRVMLAAPTGRAARRMSEASGYPAKTLHRLLEIGFSGDQGAEKQMKSLVGQLNCDLLIVDEASMIDIFLFNTLVTAIQPGTRLLLVGDADQLPSVGPGDVLQDLIESGQIPVCRLSEIFRQASESLIIHNAHRILKGQWPLLDQSFASQFLLVLKDNAQDISSAVSRLCRDILPDQYQVDPVQEVQVLTPTRKGPAGCLALNQELQNQLNDPRNLTDNTSLSAHGYRFAIGDKVMQIRNNYELAWQMADQSGSVGQGVFNGETGIVQSINPADNCLQVLYDDERRVEYDAATLDDLDLAYAITIHKSQGSEYPVVILAVAPGAPQLLTRNLLYTAVTRARKKIILVTSRRTLAAMLANETAYSRYTLLKHWLEQSEAGFPEQI